MHITRQIFIWAIKVIRFLIRYTFLTLIRRYYSISKTHWQNIKYFIPSRCYFSAEFLFISVVSQYFLFSNKRLFPFEERERFFHVAARMIRRKRERWNRILVQITSGHIPPLIGQIARPAPTEHRELCVLFVSDIERMLG